MSARAVAPALLLSCLAMALGGCGKGATGDEGAATAAAPAAAVDAGAAPAGGEAPEANPAPVKLAALGNVAQAKVGEVFVPGDWLQEWVGEGRHPDVDCEYFTGGVLPPPVSMMVMDGRIARFDLRDRGTPVVGPYGLYPGLSRAQVEQVLPRGYETSAHAYGDADDVYLTWRQPGTGLGLRVEIVDGVADALFWGDADAVTLIEGCS